jgi:DNA primase
LTSGVEVLVPITACFTFAKAGSFSAEPAQAQEAKPAKATTNNAIPK